MTTVDTTMPRTDTSLSEPDLPELAFAGGLPGFPDAKRFALVEVEHSVLFVPRSLDEAGLEFVVAPPVVFFPDYVEEIDADDVEELGLETADDALLLVVLTLGDTVDQATANLQAPVVINQRTRVAAQVLLGKGEHSLRQPLRSADPAA
ncbi:MAG: hypothetical protein JWN08_91 [Frankiales bacterium]|jgi:flagellar assembly factor FliW|nr:hypothetical protein [Frankiales bacterium]